MSQETVDDLVSSDEYSTAINTDYSGKYDAQTSIASDLIGGAGAAVVDFGASVFNSLVPEKYETSTEDLLRRVDSNALRVYQEHPDAVHTASFIGGIFVPSGLALKGLGLARAGAKGASWFSTERRAADLGKLEELMAEGPKANAAYKALRNDVFMRGAGNQILDAAVMELAVVGTMNAHPFMEDYVKDPITNFGISVALGGAIGSGIGHIADRFAIKGIEGAVQSKAFKDVIGDLAPVSEGIPLATTLHIRQGNIDSLEAMIARTKALEGNTEEAGGALTGLALNYAEQVLQLEKVTQRTEFNTMASRLLKTVPEKHHEELMDLFLKSSKFEGIDAAAALKINEKLMANGKVEATLSDEFGDFSKMVKVKQADGSVLEVEQGVTRAYYPESGGFGTVSDAAFIGRAGTLKGVTEESIIAHKQFQANAIKVPNNDMSFEIFSRSAPSMDKAYLDAMSYVDKMPVAKLATAAIDPNDLPMLNAMVARISKEQEAGTLSNLRIKLTSNQPHYDAVMETRIVNGTGVKPDYFTSLRQELHGVNYGNYAVTSQSLAPRTNQMLSRWVSAPKGKFMHDSGMQELRDAMQSYMRPSQYVTPHKDILAAKEIYESASSKNFREFMRTKADAEGNVYLYRGMHQQARGSSALESFTDTVAKGSEHGGVKLYKVHVDEIVAVMKDGAGNNKLDNIEILVSSATRKSEATLPVLGNEVAVSKLASKQISEMDVGMTDVVDAAIKAKESYIRTMLEQGKSFQEIAVRTNTPRVAVEQWVGQGGHTGSMSLIEVNGGNIFEYSSMSQLGEYLSPLKNPILVRTNIRKAPWAKTQANMDSLTLNRASAEITESLFRSGSNVGIVKDFTEFMYGRGMNDIKDIMRSQATMASNGNSGMRFINSADHYAKGMKDFGIGAVHVGKEIQGLANRTITRMMAPATPLFEATARDAVKQLEFNTAIKFNAQLSGYRIYQDRQFWIKEVTKDLEGKDVTRLVSAKFQGQDFKVATDTVDQLLTHLQGVGREIYGSKSVTNRVLGKSAMHDIGFWVPSLNMRDKHIAYVWNKADDTTQILWGNTADELNSAIEAYKPTVSKLLADKTIEIVPKGDQAGANLLKGRDDPYSMTIANVDSFHSGASSPLIVKSNADVIAEIVGGIEHTVQSHVRTMAEISMYDISDNLQRMSAINRQLTKDQPLGFITSALNKPKDAAHEMRNILFALKDLPDYTSWQSANQSFEAILGYSLNKVGKVFDTVAKPLKSFIGKKSGEVEIDYQSLSRGMEEAGVHNPYKVFGTQAEEIWGVAGLQTSKNQAARLVYATNALAATAALRFGELAQPLVNAMSFPILASAAISEKLPATFMGAKLGTSKVGIAEAMHDGIRAMHSKHFEDLGLSWEKAGYFDPIVSEASKVLKLPREFQPGAIAGTEKLIDSKLVTMMSKGADYSEALVRKVSMYTGAMLAKRMYPEIGDAGITIFARNFMDRTIGNYHAAQRPVFFQGTMGTAMGLFQTYMLTYAQTMYRQLELKDYKSMGKMMLAQTSIFGAGSLPGFHQVSELIGEHYSDDHVDLQTGLMRAVSDPIAKATLYGLPSSFGPAFYTRGEVSPRITTPANLGQLPTVNMLAQTVGAVGKVISAASSDGEDVPRALAQALSMQSISRPLARVSELATGYSVTGQGNTVESNAEVWTTTGVLSRLLATRPTEEAMLREANHLSTMYGSLDREARAKVLAKLKTAIREDTLDADKHEQMALKYMDEGGTPTGWRSAVSKAIAESTHSMSGPLRDKLKPESALNHMLDMLDD